MLPSAKFSALEVEYRVGSSKTKSIPFSSAHFALFHLSIKEVLPRWVKFPLIMATVYVQPVIFFDCSKWYKWPLWNGLYSAIMPKTLLIVIHFLIQQ